MDFEPIRTTRLILIPATGEILEYELKKEKLPENFSGITIPENWPHESVTKEVLEVFLCLYNEDRLFNYYWVLESHQNIRTDKILIGSGGFIVHENGDFELGYSVLKQFENNGYATEAIEAILRHASYSEFKGLIIAKTEEDNYPSKRVLEKSGFTVFGFDKESGLLIYSFQNDGEFPA